MKRGRIPSNRSRRALDDLRQLLDYSRGHFAPAITRRTRARLVQGFDDIDQGRAIGFVRPEIDQTGRTLFVFEAPWLIAYDPKLRQVLRIVHGACDLPTVLKSTTQDWGCFERL